MTGRDDDQDPSASASSPFDSVVGRVEAQLSRGRPIGAIDPPVPAPAAVTGRRRAVGSRDYVTGIAIGVAIVGVLLQCALAYELAAYDMDAGWTLYMPPSMKSPFVVGAAWRFGAPLVLAALVVLAHVLAGRGKRWPALVVAVLALATPAASLYIARAPYSELAGKILAE